MLSLTPILPRSHGFGPTPLPDFLASSGEEARTFARKPAHLRGPLDPPFCPVSNETGFMQTTVGGLPFPVDVLKVLAVVDQQRPDFVKDTLVVPAPDRPMHGRIAAELFGQSIPLTAGASAVDHAIKASRHRLWSTRGRPIRGGGSSSWSKGKKTLSHIGPATSQIVGSGARGAGSVAEFG